MFFSFFLIAIIENDHSSIMGKYGFYMFWSPRKQIYEKVFILNLSCWQLDIHSFLVIIGEIYWTDTDLDVIQKATQDGFNQKVIVGDGLLAADGIVVDSTGRKV